MLSVRGQRFPQPSQMDAAAAATSSAPLRLDDFELFALDRLRVLKGISDALSRGKKPEEIEKRVADLWNVHMRHPQASEAVNKDAISHFVLSEDLRKWLLSMETTLFRYRFKIQTPEAQKALLRDFNLPYKAVSGAEFESVREKLDQVACSIGTPYHQVPFE